MRSPPSVTSKHGSFLFAAVAALLSRSTEYVGYCAAGGRIYNDADAAEAKFKEVTGVYMGHAWAAWGCTENTFIPDMA